ncbi:putative 26S proteasome regulatory chain 4 [Aphelenchoides fujianensis]|nr:putative 26S proteasome regulatory chain 4 [Aphelenchoides fujianensis]
MGNAMPRGGRRQMPQHAPQKVARKPDKGGRGQDALNKLPTVFPKRQCLLRLLKLNRVHDYLLIEQQFIQHQNACKPLDSKRRAERKLIHTLRGTPTTLARIHELFNDEQHAVVCVEGSKREWYVPILCASPSPSSSFHPPLAAIVDKDLIRLNALVLVKAGGAFKNVPLAVVGVVQDSVDSKAHCYKLEKAPKESFEDIGGLEQQIQEIKESVELPLTHPDTSATFLRATGSDLVQKSSGEGARLVRELFKMAKDSAPCIVFLDEIDAVGTKRYDTSCRGEQEVQRTMLELLNQLDGFESRGDVKVIMATNRIDSLDPALIRPGRIDRKIELPKPDEKTKLRIFQIHSAGMTLEKDVKFERIVAKEHEISGADIRAICTEAGMLALRAHRKIVTANDLEKAVKNVLLKRTENKEEAMFI